MRITDIELHPVVIPYRKFNAENLFRYHGVILQERVIYVVKTDTGLEGLGEGGSMPNADALREQYVGTSPFDWVNNGQGETPLPMNMATYDLMGKHLNEPAWKLLGEKLRSWIPICYWAVSLEPEAMAQEVLEAARLGYHWLKYHTGEVQNVVDQSQAMQAVAPHGFKVHYDFNINSNFYTMCEVVMELARFPVAGRIEDALVSEDHGNYRLLREKSKLPIIIHKGGPDVMFKGLCDGYMLGHGPLNMAMHTASIAELTQTPVMYQNAGGAINQSWLAHLVAVVRNATIDHVSLCHLYDDDVTKETMPVVGGCVQVPEGPGLGISLDREKLERYKAAPKPPYERFLVCVRYHSGLDVYVRHNPNLLGCHDNLRFVDRLLKLDAPGHQPAYDSPVISEFWDPKDNPAEFEKIWKQTESGPVWVQQGNGA